MSKRKETRKAVKAAFDKWLKPLGLLWWDVTINFHDNPGDVVRIFRDPGEDNTVAAKTYVSWIYATATIEVNLPAFEGLTQEEIERIVVHECCHILVAEMREGKIHHEERVVTGLTKAFFWVESATREDNKHG